MNIILNTRLALQSFITPDHHHIDVVKDGRTYTVQVCYKGLQSDSSYPVVNGSLLQAQELVNELIINNDLESKLITAIDTLEFEYKDAILSAIKAPSLCGGGLSYSDKVITFANGNAHLVIDSQKIMADVYGKRVILSEISATDFNAVYNIVKG